MKLNKSAMRNVINCGSSGSRTALFLQLRDDRRVEEFFRNF